MARSTPDPAKLLDLPDGFTYKVISEAGAPLTGADGTLPDAFDGTALFEVDGRRFLIRNSEQGYPEEDEPIEFPAVAAPEFTYDPAAHGRDDDDGARRRQQRRGRVRQPRRHRRPTAPAASRRGARG